MDIPPNNGYVLVDANGKVRATFSRAAVEDNPTTLLPFTGFKIEKDKRRSTADLAISLSSSTWITDE